MSKDDRIKKLLEAAEIIKRQDDKDTELDTLVALTLQTGYQLGKLTAKPA